MKGQNLFILAALVLTFKVQAATRPNPEPSDVLGLMPAWQQSEKPIVDPAGYFTVRISPRYFECDAEPKSLKCKGLLAVDALLTVEIKAVPKKASVDLFALIQYETFQTKERFRPLSRLRTRTTIDEMSAILQSFTFDNLGNPSLPIWVQFIDVLQKENLAVLQITCASRDCSEYGPALVQIQQSFRMAPILKNGKPDTRKLLAQKGEMREWFPVKELEK